jgi:hypothetical protein
MATRNDSVADQFEKALGELKLERLTAMDAAGEIHIAMQSLLQHEAQRIANKLGAEHPRSQQLKASLQSNAQRFRQLEVERQLLRINVPEVADEGALVHGRIVDEDDFGVERLTLCLVDRAGAPVQETGEPTTDRSGYFAIVLDPEMVDRLIKRHPDGIFLAIFTSRQRLLHRQLKPLALARKARLFVKVVLDLKNLNTGPADPSCPVVTPDLVGKTESAAVAALREVELRLGELQTKVTSDQPGRVLQQSPAAGTRVAPGSSISLVIGVGETRTVQVPNLINITLKAAKRKIKTAGLKFGTVSGSSPTGQSIVEEQEPQADAEVPVDTTVNLTIQSAKT